MPKSLLRCLACVLAVALLAFPLAPGARADSFYPSSGAGSTDSAEPVAPGHVESWFYCGSTKGRDVPFAGALSLNYKFGIAERFDFALSLPYTFVTDEASKLYGFNDPAFGLKYLLRKPREGRPAASLAFGFKPAAATVASGLGNGVLDSSAHLALTWSQKKITHICDLGFTFWGDLPGQDLVPTPYYKYGVVYAVTERHSLSLELYGERDRNPSPAVAPLEALVHSAYQLNERLNADIGVAVGLNRDAPERRIVFCLTFAR